MMTTLFKQFPIAEKLWADDKDPSKYTIESKANISWKCDKGHDLRRQSINSSLIKIVLYARNKQIG